MRSFFSHHLLLPGLLVMAAIWGLGVSCSLMAGLHAGAYPGGKAAHNGGGDRYGNQPTGIGNYLAS